MRGQIWSDIRETNNRDARRRDVWSIYECEGGEGDEDSSVFF